MFNRFWGLPPRISCNTNNADEEIKLANYNFEAREKFRFEKIKFLFQAFGALGTVAAALIAYSQYVQNSENELARRQQEAFIQISNRVAKTEVKDEMMVAEGLATLPVFSETKDPVYFKQSFNLIMYNMINEARIQKKYRNVCYAKRMERDRSNWWSDDTKNRKLLPHAFHIFEGCSTQSMIEIAGVDALSQIKQNIQNLNRNLYSFDFHSKNINYVNLKNANLRNSYFSDSAISSVNLSMVGLGNSSFFTVVLRDSILSDSDFDGVYMKNSLIVASDLSGITLKNAKMIRMQIYYSNMQNANLENSEFLNANLNCVDLDSANFKNANFSKARLQRARLTNSNLEKAKGLETASLDYSVMNRQTYNLLPDIVKKKYKAVDFVNFYKPQVVRLFKQGKTPTDTIEQKCYFEDVNSVLNSFSG